MPGGRGAHHSGTHARQREQEGNTEPEEAAVAAGGAPHPEQVSHLAPQFWPRDMRVGVFSPLRTVGEQGQKRGERHLSTYFKKGFFFLPGEQLEP